MRLLKEMFIIFVGVLAFIYLLNPGIGFLEFIPDYLPVVGNIDEGFATAVLIAVLRYYGLDISRLFGGRTKQRSYMPPQHDPNLEQRREQR